MVVIEVIGMIQRFGSVPFFCALYFNRTEICLLRRTGFTVGRREPSTTTEAAAAAAAEEEEDVTGTGGCMYILFFACSICYVSSPRSVFSGVMITCP